ncbi:MAG: alpha/beta hydrolase [Bacteroidales bacterium]
MRRFLIYIVLFLSGFLVKAQYVADELGKSFVKRTITMPTDYEGKVVCTLVKNLENTTSNKAVLYIHGNNDYFYQAQMASRFAKAGYRFYAMDLRKYGRSILPGQYANNARDLSDYFADIDTANTIIRKEGATKIVLIGHSTGGLITSVYADSKGKNLKFDAMILNAPFFEFNENWFNKQIAAPVVSALGRFFPNMEIAASPSTAYGESLHKNYHGEWVFDLQKKHLALGNKRWCWIRAIHVAQTKVHDGLSIQCPILTLSSDKSIHVGSWNVGYQTADGVLNVKDIQHYSHNLGNNSSLAIVPGGMHDLVLSKKNVRDAVYREMFRWLSKQRL